jgi:hypothetical protein
MRQRECEVFCLSLCASALKYWHILPQGEDEGEGLSAAVRNAILTVEPAFII